LNVFVAKISKKVTDFLNMKQLLNQDNLDDIINRRGGLYASSPYLEYKKEK